MMNPASVPAWFNVSKAAQVAAWFTLVAGGRINILKLTKLIYLSDRESMRRRDVSITDDNFVSMKYGPVNSITYRHLNEKAYSKRPEWRKFVGERIGNDIPAADGVSIDDMDELSRLELRILDDIWGEFKDIDRFSLAEWTHRFCPEWQDPGQSSIPIDHATIFAKLDKTEPVSLAENIRAERTFKAKHVLGA